MANQAQIKKALQRPYDLNLFAKEVLNPVFGSNFQMNINPVPASVELNKAENKVIRKVLIYGKMELEDLTEITCYEIQLHENSKIEYSKVAIQRYVRKLLGNGQAALINFVNPANKNIWRFTYIANERTINEKGERVSKLVNAKRYTYLLGTYESCKTAAERFEILSTETSLTMETLTKAFSVEKLSKSFFDEYLRHYDNFVAYLTQSNFKTSVFSGDEKAIRDFSKKLLGRIVFLYFVQKKGWLGASDLEYKDGLQNFMTEFYNLAGANDAFYNNFLKTLFFETLNKSRKNDDFAMPDGTVRKIPFLNGGLFDKEKVDENILTFKPELFHNIWDEENPKTRGFLDFLNAYNFTVYEDSPDEQTVAVDPEMLGHIFENLLEDNKDKGAFYTPKEIVHYMCQESLAEYLLTNYELRIKNYELRNDDLKENIRNLVVKKEISTLTKPELQEIDKLLDTVKICDPAIGSGAFPVGLLQEIFAIKELIAYETGTEWKPAAVKENIIQNSIYGVDIEKGAVDIARLRFWLSLVVDEEKPKALPNLDYKIVTGNSLVSKFEDEIIEIDWSTDTTKAGMYGQDIAQKRIDLLTDLTKKQKQFFHSEKLDKKKCALEIRNLKIDILINQLELMIKTKGLETQPTYGKKITEQAELYLKTEGWKKMVSTLKALKSQAEKPLNYFDWQLDFPEVLNQNLIGEKNNAQVETTNSQIVALNKQIDAINLHLKQNNISEHLIHLQVNIATEQITLVKEQLAEIEKTISTIYGELTKVDTKIVREPDLSFVYKVKGINKGIDTINKKVEKINPKLQKENSNNELGFDIVIGNPPYDVYEGKKKFEIEDILKNEIYQKCKGGKINAFELFLAKIHELLKTNGVECQIFQNSFLADNSSRNLREFYFKNQKIISIDSFPERDNPKKRVFESAKMSVCILKSVKCKVDDYLFNVNFWEDKNKQLGVNTIFTVSEIFLFDTKQLIIPNLKQEEKNVFRNYYSTDLKYADLFDCLEGELNMTFHKDYMTSNSKNPLIVKGAQIQRYYVSEKPSQGQIVFVDEINYLKNYSKSAKSKHHSMQRIALQGISGANDKIRIISTLISKNVYCANSCNYIITSNENKICSLKSLLGIFNSKLTNYIFRKTSTNSNVNCYEINNLHLPNRIKVSNINVIEKFVDEILTKKKTGIDTSELELKIDEMVYELYELTGEEIKIVEGK